MKFISTRIITADVNRLVDFYEMVTEVSAVWGNEMFAEIPTPIGTLAIGSDKTVPLFGDGSADNDRRPRPTRRAHEHTPAHGGSPHGTALRSTTGCSDLLP